MSYTPPFDLLIQLDFAPNAHDGWRCYLIDEDQDPYYIQVTCNETTRLTAISYNRTLADGAAWKDMAFMGLLRDESHFRQALADAGWTTEEA